MASGESRNRQKRGAVRDNVSAHAGRIRLRGFFGAVCPTSPNSRTAERPAGRPPDSRVRGIPAGGPWPVRVGEQQVILVLRSRDVDITNYE